MLVQTCKLQQWLKNSFTGLKPKTLPIPAGACGLAISESGFWDMLVNFSIRATPLNWVWAELTGCSVCLFFQTSYASRQEAHYLCILSSSNPQSLKSLSEWDMYAMTPPLTAYVWYYHVFIKGFWILKAVSLKWKEDSSQGPCFFVYSFPLRIGPMYSFCLLFIYVIISLSYISHKYSSAHAQWCLFTICRIFQ